MIHGVRYVRQDISYISKKHSCPICNTFLNTIEVSKIINSNSEEAKKITPIIPGTVIGTRGLKFRNYTAIGNIKWIWKEFECPNCCHRFTVEQMKQIEASPKECWEDIVASFDEFCEQANEENPKIDATINKNQNSTKPLKIALCIAIPVIIIALVLVAFIIVSTSKFVDTNGPYNFALTEITRDDILNKDNSYRSSMMSEKYYGLRTNVIGTRFRDCDYDYISKSFEKVYGVLTVQATRISSDSLTLNINSSVESGNAEIIILIDREYYCSVDVNENKSITLHGIANKEVLVKLAGEDAKIKIDVSRIY